MCHFDENKLLALCLNFLVVERENYNNIVLTEIFDLTCLTLFPL